MYTLRAVVALFVFGLGVSWVMPGCRAERSSSEEIGEAQEADCHQVNNPCDVHAPSCCANLGCLPGLFGGPARCVPLGCTNGEVPCGPDAPDTICCTGQCIQRDDGAYKCSYY
jgi:hypothetical protein